jgi:hypothetical protein
MDGMKSLANVAYLLLDNSARFFRRITLLFVR